MHFITSKKLSKIILVAILIVVSVIFIQRGFSESKIDPLMKSLACNIESIDGIKANQVSIEWVNGHTRWWRSAPPVICLYGINDSSVQDNVTAWVKSNRMTAEYSKLEIEFYDARTDAYNETPAKLIRIIIIEGNTQKTLIDKKFKWEESRTPQAVPLEVRGTATRTTTPNANAPRN